MSLPHYRFIALLASAVLGSMVALTACSQGPNDADSEELIGAPEDVGTNHDGLSGSVAVGSTLIATTGVNLRTGPSTSDSILHVVPSGASVTVLDANPQNGFYHVKHNGQSGWSFGQYYKLGSSPQPASGGGATMVSTGDVNLRNGPGTSYSIIEVVPDGSSVTLVDAAPQNNFYHINYKGTVGWSSATYLKTGTSSGSGGGSNPPPSSSGPRGEAIARAKSAVGFSYWWGHGRFRPEGPSGGNAGSCSGSCPSCSHSGSYGGDCSGMVAKAWSVPGSNSDLTNDEHPYSTATFVSDTSQWHTVSRGNVQSADAMVYNSGGAGHIFLYSSGDGWGSMYAYECKGCSAGCVYDLRTASSAYHAIRHTGW